MRRTAQTLINDCRAGANDNTNADNLSTGGAKDSKTLHNHSIFRAIKEGVRKTARTQITSQWTDAKDSTIADNLSRARCAGLGRMYK